VRALDDGADEVRLAAALALESLVDGELPDGSREALRAAVPGLLHDPIERARVAGVTILGRLSVEGEPDAATLRERLVEALADPSPSWRERAVEYWCAPVRMPSRRCVSNLRLQIPTCARWRRWCWPGSIPVDTRPSARAHP